MAKTKLVKIDSVLPRTTIKYSGRLLFYSTDVLVEYKPFALCFSFDGDSSSPVSMLLPLDTIVEVKVYKPKGGVRK